MTHAAVVTSCSTRVQQQNGRASRINTYKLLDVKTKERRMPKRYSTHKYRNTQQRQHEGQPQPIGGGEKTTEITKATTTSTTEREYNARTQRRNE